MNKITVVLLVLGCLLSSGGCRKKQEKPLMPGLIVADKQVALADMAPSDIIVSVNGQALTRQAYEDGLDLYTTLFTFRSSAANQMTINAYRSNRGATSILEYVPKQLILQEGRRLGIRLSPEALTAAEQETWKKTAPRRAGEDFVTVLGAKASQFKQHVAEDEYVKATRKALFADRLAVSDEEVDAAMKRRADWNEVYVESNRVVMARGEEIVRELRAGSDFAEMAMRVSQHGPEDGKEWGEFTREEIDDPKLREVAFQLPVGGISDPIDTEHGLIIIRVLEQTSGAAVESAVAQRVASVKLAKILLLMYNAFDKISHEQLRANIEKDRISEVQKEWVPQLYKTATIEYPNGTNLWPKAKSRARRN